MSQNVRLVVRSLLLGFLIATLIAPVPAWSASAPLGTARGARGVELSLDDGRTWFSLRVGSLPVMDASKIRSTGGGALVDLADGSRINVLPFSAVSFRATASATEITLHHGWLTFRLPQETRVEIRTSAARLEPVPTQPMVGELFVAADGTIGIQMKGGNVRVHELSGGRRVMLASLEPVFLPKRPATASPLFSTDAPATPPAGAKGLYSPKGESIGYLRPDKQLVVHPGFTNDLTQSFSPKLIQLAMARIPEAQRSDAVPLFDVHGGYVGYLAGPVFYAQAQVAQAQLGAAAEAGIPTWVWVAGGIVLVGGGFGGAVAAGAFDDDQGGPGVVSTPLRPRR